MLVPFNADTRVTLGIVALGTAQRLKECLDSVASHVSRHDFSVVCVVNPATADASAALDFAIPEGVLLIEQKINVGWPGGLHVVRSRIRSELLVWVQEDMLVLDGWLDALVDAADTHKEHAAFGSSSIDEIGRPTGVSFGSADPPHDIRLWKLTAEQTDAVPPGVTKADWVTGKGMLVRLNAWDEIGGANPTYYPLNHVDHDYCTHLRAHGMSVAVVSEARVIHHGSQSAPSMFRRFVGEYRDPAFNTSWGPVLAQLATGAANAAHDCKPWFAEATQTNDPISHIERICGIEASLMLVAFAKWSNRFVDSAVSHQRDVDNHELLASIATIDARWRRRSLLWQLSRPLRVLRRTPWPRRDERG